MLKYSKFHDDANILVYLYFFTFYLYFMNYTFKMTIILVFTEKKDSFTYKYL